MMNWNRKNLYKIKGQGGIYIFRNKIDGKIYIGQTVDFYMRYFTHVTRKNPTIFSKCLWKYGEQQFQFGILEIITDRSRLNKREQYWIEFFKSYKRENGYNQSRYPHPFKRKRFSNEHRQRISSALKGIKRSPDSYKRGALTRVKLGVKCASQRIAQIDINTLQIIEIFDSIKQAADITNTPRRSISYAISTFLDRRYKDRLYPKAGNFYWQLQKPTL